MRLESPSHTVSSVSVSGI